MYKIFTYKTTVGIPPKLFDKKTTEAALEILREKFERTIDKDEKAIIVSVHNAKILGDGKIVPGDPEAHYEAEFEALIFQPKINEIVFGEVSEIVEFGAFVRLGPIDGLVHVSQIANDFFSYDKKQGILQGKETKKIIKRGDKVAAKIATISLRSNIPDSKIALTMRPEGLGKISK